MWKVQECHPVRPVRPATIQTELIVWRAALPNLDVCSVQTTAQTALSVMRETILYKVEGNASVQSGIFRMLQHRHA